MHFPQVFSLVDFGFCFAAFSIPEPFYVYKATEAALPCCKRNCSKENNLCLMLFELSLFTIGKSRTHFDHSDSNLCSHWTTCRLLIGSYSFMTLAAESSTHEHTHFEIGKQIENVKDFARLWCLTTQWATIYILCVSEIRPKNIVSFCFIFNGRHTMKNIPVDVIYCWCCFD